MDSLGCCRVHDVDNQERVLERMEATEDPEARNISVEVVQLPLPDLTTEKSEGFSHYGEDRPPS